MLPRANGVDAHWQWLGDARLVKCAMIPSLPSAWPQYENELERLRTEGLAEHGALKRK